MLTAIPTRQPADGAGGSGSTVSNLFISELVIPGQPEHVQAARAFTALVLRAHSRDDEGIADLLVSELVTNSLLHSDSGKPDGIVTVLVAVMPGEIHIEVTDDGGTGEPAVNTAADNETAESGRGLRLVERLSASWGHYRCGRHLTTWFEFPTGQERCTSAASASTRSSARKETL